MEDIITSCWEDTITGVNRVEGARHSVAKPLSLSPREDILGNGRTGENELRVVGGQQCRALAGRKQPVMIDPSPELPDDMPIASVELPPKVRQALIAAGLRTIGKIRETSDTEILRIQHLGQSSLNFLRDTLGRHPPWESAGTPFQ
jgi:hypothetical protein